MSSRSTEDRNRCAQPRANRLVNERSLYLLQHASNPVDWYPWGDEAFVQARESKKPVFLSVGYATCHWCHVMERESFSQEDVARILNEHFVPVKVDREERPDIDDLYMLATQLMTGRGGWPNSVWLTPEGEPWYAGTYFPKEDAWGRMSFKSVLRQLAELWANHAEDVRKRAKQVSAALQRVANAHQIRESSWPPTELLSRSVAEIKRGFDDVRGGLSGAPKFPPHGALQLFIASCARTSDPESLAWITRTLEAMGHGGIRDHLGGGFHRYATDEAWRWPHFEKMLHDNALLLRSYADAAILTRRDDFRQVASEIADWVLREMTSPDPGFFSAMDADSEGLEGRFYLWTQSEVFELLGSQDAELFCQIYGVTEEGNFRDEATRHETGLNVLLLDRPMAAWIHPSGRNQEGFSAWRSQCRLRLFEARQKRVRPLIDDQILTGWNGLMMGSLAHAGWVLGRPEWVRKAEEVARFILSAHWKDCRLSRASRDGVGSGLGFLDDHAGLVDGLLDLFEATGDPHHIERAEDIVQEMIRRFHDPDGSGFFLAPLDCSDLLMRSKDAFDEAIPSGNAMACHALIRLGKRLGRQEFLDLAQGSLMAFMGLMAHFPRGTEGLLACLAESQYE